MMYKGKIKFVGEKDYTAFWNGVKDFLGLCAIAAVWYVAMVLLYGVMG